MIGLTQCYGGQMKSLCKRTIAFLGELGLERCQLMFRLLVAPNLQSPRRLCTTELASFGSKICTTSNTITLNDATLTTKPTWLVSH